jgi:signal transduction histidine kinase
LHRASGSGLGLPIAKALVLSHGGSLTLQSPANERLGTGTCVVLQLPLLPNTGAAPLITPSPV